MKVKTSVTLSKDVLLEIDRLAGRNQSRSAVIEQAVRALIAAKARRERYEREIEIINKHADELNREAADALSYQIDL